MKIEDVNILIPSHSLEDFPTDVGEKEAASLLNAFAVAWHPLLLASTGAIPSWHRSDEPPELCHGKLFLVPTASDDWLPHDWPALARDNGGAVVTGISDRDEMTAAALAHLDDTPDIDADLVADFLAFGTCHLWIELLTRYMHHFDSPDESVLQRDAVAAAEAAIGGDMETARERLGSCFECLTECRERFYPVDCFLIDLCLLVPDVADDKLSNTLANQTPLNILATGDDLDTIAADRSDLVEQIAAAWDDGQVNLVGGDRFEGPSPLVPLESALRDAREGRATFQRLFGRLPKTWARRRYGFSTLLPLLLSRSGYHSGLHVALDDGIYPDAENSKVRWEGCDGTVIDGMTRIPLAADSASSFARFAHRMSETMEEDMVAAVTFARWPDVASPWLGDLRRMAGYSPVLGRFVTYDQFVEDTDTPGRLSTYAARDYLSPFLIQSVARDEPSPISRFTGHFQRRHRLNTAMWMEAAAHALVGRQPETDQQAELETTVEQAGPDDESSSAAAAVSALDEYELAAAARLTEIVMHGAGEQPGCLLINPLSSTRRAAIGLPDSVPAPEVVDAVKAVQDGKQHRVAVVDIPGSGYLWVPTKASPTAWQPDDPPLAEQCLLRNEFFEVHINPETGGIATIKGHGRQPNRLSQQLAFRFPSERTLQPASEDREQVQSYYSEMRCRKTEIVSAGPAVGEIVTSGEIVDQLDNSTLAAFRQTVRVFRACRSIELDLELSDITRMPEGDPWSNYFASRFAWNDAAASLTRSIFGQAQGFKGERFESPHYFEIAGSEERTTILNHGLPYHRKTGMRMVDSILIVAGETETRFRFTIAVDSTYPTASALDAMTPVVAVPTSTGPPRSGTSGWFFNVSAKNVQITRVLNLMDVPPPESDFDADPDGQPPGDAPGQTETAQSAPPETQPAIPDRGFALRLVETEGRRRQIRLQCFAVPTFARKRDFLGGTVNDLTIHGDDVLVDMNGYEVADVELRFGTSP